MYLLCSKVFEIIFFVPMCYFYIVGLSVHSGIYGHLSNTLLFQQAKKETTKQLMMKNNFHIWIWKYLCVPLTSNTHQCHMYN